MTAPLPLTELTRRAVHLLARELGPADAARFVGQFAAGAGDYTAERVALFDGLSVAELAADIRSAVAVRQTPDPEAGPPAPG